MNRRTRVKLFIDVCSAPELSEVFTLVTPGAQNRDNRVLEVNNITVVVGLCSCLKFYNNITKK